MLYSGVKGTMIERHDFLADYRKVVCYAEVVDGVMIGQEFIEQVPVTYAYAFACPLIFPIGPSDTNRAKLGS